MVTFGDNKLNEVIKQSEFCSSIHMRFPFRAIFQSVGSNAGLIR
jgi:hypothetical protein